jgi:hypothetical protein
MATKINIRSPFYYKVSNANLASADLTISIGTGLVGSVVERYNLTKTEAGTNNYVVFEISELVRDYITTEFSGSYNNEPVWVKLDYIVRNTAGEQQTNGSDTYLAFYGYVEYEGGIQNNSVSTNQGSRNKLFSNNKIFIPDNETLVIPVFTEDVADVTFQGDTTTVVTTTSTTDTSSKIAYASVNLASVGNVTNVLIETITGDINVPVEVIDCSKYDPLKVTFYNKSGALQDLFFFAKNIESVSRTAEKYKSSVYNAGTNSYSINQHQYANLSVTGKESVTLNTGYVSQEYNEPIKELMMSEKVWLTKNSVVYPINVTSSSVQFKNRLNDSLVAYTIEAEYAFDTVQNVR